MLRVNGRRRRLPAVAPKVRTADKTHYVNFSTGDGSYAARSIREDSPRYLVGLPVSPGSGLLLAGSPRRASRRAPRDRTSRKGRQLRSRTLRALRRCHAT